MFSRLAATALVAWATFESVAADPANPLDIALVTQQFVNALITPSVVPVFDPTAVMNVTFSSVGTITTGQAIAMADVSTMPTIAVAGTAADFASGGDLNTTAKYTIIMIDGDIAGATNPNGTNTHWLQNDLSFSQAVNDVVSFTSTTAPVISYAGPGPASGSGAHRYTILLLPQPTDFTAPATPAAGSSVTMISFPDYLQAAQLGNPIAGNYFTVEVGTPTVSASATSAVNTATLQVASSAASGGASSSVSHSAAAATTTAAKKSGAEAISAKGFAAVAVAGAAIALFA